MFAILEFLFPLRSGDSAELLGFTMNEKVDQLDLSLHCLTHFRTRQNRAKHPRCISKEQ